jgi:hypothetical protein
MTEARLSLRADMPIDSAGELTMTRPARFCVCAALLAAVACSRGSAFPETIVFGQQTLTRGAPWARQGMIGVVYVGPGETMPSAALQVGAIMSTDHLTSDALHTWIRDEVGRSGALHFHESNLADESCRIAKTRTRLYLALEVCKTGVARAICVEADEAITEAAVGPCLGSSSNCFVDLCDKRWLARREALDGLAADLLTKR